MSENGKKSGFALMDEMERKQQDGSEARRRSDGIDYWKRNARRSVYRALDGLDLKLPWLMLAGVLILVLDEMLQCFPTWVSDVGAVIALVGAVQYVISIGIKIYRKKKNGD